MRVRMLSAIAGEGFCFQQTEIADLPEQMCQDLLKAGYASLNDSTGRPIQQDNGSDGLVAETAMVIPTENAMKKRGRPRKLATATENQ